MTHDLDGTTPPADLDTAFRAALGRFASGVTLVSTVSDGVDHAMTASAFCSVGMSPPLVLVCVDRRNRIHDAVLDSGTWGVSILAQDGQDAASWLALRGRPLENQMAVVEHHRGPVTGVALADTALAWLECRTWQSYDGGDHTILVGEVVAAGVRGDDRPAAGDTSDGDKDDPLLYYRSHYGSLVRSPDSEKNSGTLGDRAGGDGAGGEGQGR